MDKQDNLDRIIIVLVDTSDGANIGSVCRAMKTMGLSRLTLVTDRTYDEGRVSALAVHAFDVYQNRRECRTLAEALEPCVLSVASTRRRGKFRKGSSLSPQQLSDRIEALGEGPVAIVFGREADGLTDEEVAECDMVVTIPTSPAFPSLNLSQAVQIICYNLYDRLKPYPTDMIPVTGARIDKAVETAVESLRTIGYFKPRTDEERLTMLTLRDAFARAAFSEGELKRIEKIFTKSALISTHRIKEEN